MRYICKSGGAFAANTYLIIGDHNELLIIDPTDADYISSLIIRNNLIPTAILLTHGHFDHICAVAELFDRYTIPAYIHSADVEMLSDPVKNVLRFFYPDAPYRQPHGQVITINDGEQLAFDGFKNPITVFHTPGHSKGSVCYLFNESDSKPTMFTGDLLFAGSIGRTDMFGGSSYEMRESLHKLTLLSDEVVICPGHGPSSDIISEKDCNPYFR